MDHYLDERVEDQPDPEDERVEARAESLKREEGKMIDDARSAARTLLKESDARLVDPATRDLDDDRVERRSSDESV